MKPQLGVVRSRDEEFVLADLPGLIEGASEGVGLGHRFLGHVERCAVILHLVDATLDDVVGAWRTIRGELKAYGARSQPTSPRSSALNKIGRGRSQGHGEEAPGAANAPAPALSW